MFNVELLPDVVKNIQEIKSVIRVSKTPIHCNENFRDVGVTVVAQLTGAIEPGDCPR